MRTNGSEEKGIPIDGVGATSSTAASGSGPQLTAGTAGAFAANQAAGSTARQNNINPFTNKAFSQKYHTLYRKRITLPVFEYRADFMRLLAENQCIVLVGEVSVLTLFEFGNSVCSLALRSTERFHSTLFFVWKRLKTINVNVNISERRTMLNEYYERTTERIDFLFSFSVFVRI